MTAPKARAADWTVQGEWGGGWGGTSDEGRRWVQRAGGAKQTLLAEWTKLRTLPGTVWLLLGIVAATVAVSAVTAAGANCPAAGCAQDPARMSLAGVDLGQAMVAVLAVLIISSEYSTGMISLTLAALPSRTGVLAAKAAVLTGLVLVTGSLAVAGSLLAGRLILPGHGFTAGHGFAPLSLADGPVLRAAVGSVLYLALIALLSLGVATVVRDSAAAIGVTLGLIYLFPVVGTALGRTLAAVPAAGRADERRAGYPGHHRPAQPAAQPVGRPGRAGRLGRRRAADRRPAAPPPRRVTLLHDCRRGTWCPVRWRCPGPPYPSAPAGRRPQAPMNAKPQPRKSGSWSLASSLASSAAVITPEEINGPAMAAMLSR